MFRPLVCVSLVLSLLVAFTPTVPQAAGVDRRQNDAPRTWFAGLHIYAFMGNWLIDKFASAETTRHMSVAPPVTAFLDPAPLFIGAPLDLTVVSASNTAMDLSWTAPGGAVDHYQLEYSQTFSGPFLFLANTMSTSFSHTTVSSGHAYLYRVRAFSNDGTVSSPSNMALGTAISFEFSALQGQSIKARHLNDLRTAVNAVRYAAEMQPVTWTRGALAGLTINATDVQELRNGLDPALSVLQISADAYHDATLTPGTTAIKAIHLEQLQARSTRGRSNSSGPFDSDSSSARLDPMNETGGDGENPLSRNFNWTLPIVSLPGRGIDLSLTLSYNSLVWTRAGNYISFDDDRGFPGPGFRLGFPVIQHLYYNSQTGKMAYLFIASDGSRIELRQVGTSGLFESADSSHLLFDSSNMVLRTADGTQLQYAAMAGEYHCTQLADRNGNYITINYTQLGSIDTVIDTLGRSLKFNYANGWLTSITQIWNQNSPAPVTHNWARFTYADSQIDTNFSVPVNGPVDPSTIKMLTRLTLADNSHYDFSPTSWGQVWKISLFAADGHLLSYRAYNLPQSADPQVLFEDCPRFTERFEWVQFWNGDTNGNVATEEEALTTVAVPVSDVWTNPDGSQQTGKRAQVTLPDGTSNKIYFIGAAGNSSGWRRGLPALVDTYSGGSLPVRRVTTTWSQDDTSVSFPQNPRVMETNIYDDANNRVRTQMTYEQVTFPNGTSCFLPHDVYEYAADAQTNLRTTRTLYNPNPSYADRHILGLVSEKELYEGDANTNGVLMSKVGLFYDESGSIDGSAAPVQHDNVNYGASFVVGRANLSSVKRYDVTNTDVFTKTSSRFNTAGAVVSSKDASSHEVTFSYTDAFSDGNNTRDTFAYPTAVNNADGYSSTFKYNFDFGAVTYTRTPQPNTTANTPGPEHAFTFDLIGRLQQTTNLVNNAYTRFEYATSQIRVDTYQTIQEGSGEAHTFAITDGVGRVIATASDHPGSVGGFSGRKIFFDVRGRIAKTSNPAETNASGAPSQWTTVGDDATAGWIYTEQTYDWKDRPLLTTFPSITTNPAETTTRQLSYVGCGCAGGQVVTITDEGTTLAGGVIKKRQQKLYSDVLGRVVKEESLNWDGPDPNGTDGSVYATTTVTYNARDQVTRIRKFAGNTSSSSFQEITRSYDPFGRLKTEHRPEQQVDPVNSASSDHFTWNYNADDTIQSVVDARGVITSFIYNARHLPTSIVHDSTNIPASVNLIPTASVALAYDSVGNRTSMTDGSGVTLYHFDQLSRLDWEERTFSGLPAAGSFRLAYEYSLGGVLKKVTDQRSNTSFTQSLDKFGRVTAVSGTAPNGNQTQFASQVQYRASGDLKSRTQGSSTLSLTYNARGLVDSYSVSGFGFSYQYHNDGTIKFVDDQSPYGGDPLKDRAYTYDAVRRVQETFSGAEARDFVNNTSGSTPDGPYHHSYSYDAWNNLVNDTGRFWSRNTTTEANYDSTNRNPAWSYDANGNVLTRNEIPDITPFQPARYEFDAAGRKVRSSQTRSRVVPDQGTFTDSFVNTNEFDGDGQLVHYSLVRNTVAESAYVLRSTVLGGLAISEYKADGTWNSSYVYAGTERIGQQRTDENGSYLSIWHNSDPVTGDGIDTLASGNLFGRTTLDDGGVNVGDSDPFPADGSADSDGLVAGDGSLVSKGAGELVASSAGSVKCILDGLEVDCSFVRSESSRECANGDCSPQRLPGGVWAIFLGNGLWLSDGHSSEHIFLDDTEEFRSPQRKRKKTSPRRRQTAPVSEVISGGSTKREYPPVTEAEINTVGSSDSFDQIQNSVIRALLDIANDQKCSDAFKRNHIRIPYDVILADKINIVPQAFLKDRGASRALGVSQDRLDSAAYDLSNGYIFQGAAAVLLTGNHRPALIIGQNITERRFKSIKSVIVHEFIHAGGVRGQGGGVNGDLTFMGDAYRDIQAACGGESN
jgi:fibronectin type III domain protein